ncbi:MAG: glycosyltransferase family 87 protein [Vicinamibacterales bacterium]
MNERWRRQSDWLFWGLFLVLGLYRVSLCVQVPTHTADALRHLGFTAHLPQEGWRFYTHVGDDFRPEAWTDVWGNLKYFYPPVTAVFFAAFAWLQFGLAPLKLVLTACDVASALVLRRVFSPWAALVFFANPVSMFYTSHEGQFEALQTLFILLTALATIRRHWFGAGLLLALSGQVKLFGFFLGPWLLEQLLRHSGNRRTDLRRAATGFAIGVLPFAGFYVVAPKLLLFALEGNGRRFNPFFWNPYDQSYFEWIPTWMAEWMSGVSWAILIVAALATFLMAVRRESFTAGLPLLLFWGPLKRVAWTEFWYPIVSPGFLVCLLPRRRLAWGLLLLHTTVCVRSVMILGGAPHFGFKEPEYRVEWMATCLWRCDARTLRDTR